MSAAPSALGKPSLGALISVVALDLLGFGMVVPLLPLYGSRFALDGSQIGWLLASYSLMQLLFAPMWGALSDRLGRRPILLCSLCGQLVALIALARAHSFFGLVLSRTLAGAFAANVAVAQAYIADVSSARERPRRMGMLGAAFGFGFVCGPALAGELSVWHPSAPAWGAAALAACNLLAALLWLPESRTPGACSTSGVVHDALRSRFVALRRLPALWAPLGLVFGQIFGFAAMELSLTLFAAESFGLEARDSGRLLAFVGLVLIAVQGGAMAPLSRRLAAQMLVRIGLLLMAVGMALLVLSPLFGTGAMFVALALLAMGQGITSPSLSAWVAQRSGEARFGLGLGLSQSASALARTLGPVAAGLAIDWGNTTTPLWLGAAWLTALWIGACLAPMAAAKLCGPLVGSKGAHTAVHDAI